MNKIFFGDCIQSLQALPEKFIHTCVTSPPYFGLRQYFADAVRIKQGLSPEMRAWVENQLKEAGVHAHK